jgi:hypothetical protein
MSINQEQVPYESQVKEISRASTTKVEPPFGKPVGMGYENPFKWFFLVVLILVVSHM